jgi:hypothetical protein
MNYGISGVEVTANTAAAAALSKENGPPKRAGRLNINRKFAAKRRSTSYE